MSSLMAESWSVAIRNTHCGDILNDTDSEFIVLQNGIKAWAADPFVFEKDGKVYIFAELFDYVTSLGTIGYCIYEGNPKVKWHQVITEPYHMSFPFIFENDGEIYIMPETSSNHTLSLYKAIEFPDKWEKCCDLINDDVVVDSVLFHKNNKEYAFTYDNYKDKDCYLWLCEYNDGKVIKKHRITSDVNCARMAGAVFVKNDKYYRPSQNCYDGYGKGLNFVSFSLDDGYRENIEKTIFPHDVSLSKKLFLDGMHTYNSSGNYEVIDIKTKRFNIINFIVRIIGVFKRNLIRK